MLKFLTRLLKLILVATVLSYISICAMMWYKQRDFLFANFNRNIPMESLGLTETELVWLQTPDGEKLESLHHPAPPNRPIVLYFHGKGSEVSNDVDSLKFFQKHDFGFLGISYRGFGKSSGSPSESGLITDAVTAYDWLRTKGVEPHRIMVLGQSLGSGIATQLAAQKQIAALALGAPYTSTVEIAEQAYWYLPVRLLMKDQFWSSLHIDKIKAPLYILHGALDQTIPAHFGRKMFERASEPKQFNLIEGQGHQIILDHSSLIEYAKFFDSVYSKNLAAQ